MHFTVVVRALVLRGNNDKATRMLHLIHDDGTVALGAHLHTTPLHVYNITF